MDPSKSNMNNPYNGYRGQGGMGLRFGDSSYGDLTTNDGGYGNPAMGSMGSMGAMGSMGSMGFGMGFGDNVGMPGLENMIPPNDQNMNYYQEYCRLFIANVVLTTQMKELIAEKNELLTRLSELERGEKHVKEPSTSEPATDKKSRLRRKAAEIERHYKCPVESCQKNYGSEGSLMQHVKLKHPEFTEDPDWKVKILGKSEGSEEHKD